MMLFDVISKVITSIDSDKMTTTSQESLCSIKKNFVFHKSEAN